MQIEKQVAEAYKVQAMDIQSPEEVDARIIHQYENHIRNKRGMPMRPAKKRTIQLILIGLLVLMISAFTVQYFVKIGDDRYSIENTVSKYENYNPETASVIRAQLEQVKSQLSVGESAIVYSKEMGEIVLKSLQMPYAEVVSNPQVYTDYVTWQDKLNSQLSEFKLPVVLEGDLLFEGGVEERPYGGLIMSEHFPIVDKLHEEVNQMGKDVAWQKFDQDMEKFPVFTTLYRDGHQDVIKVSMEIIKQKMKFVGVVNGTQEKVTVNGQEALYSESDKFLYSETNEYQSLTWVETLEDKSVVYSVGSSGKQITKEKLVAIAESMK